MKKMITRNKVIVTVLALLIALAGYLNYTDTLSKGGNETAGRVDTQTAMEAKGDTYTYDVVNDVVEDEYSEVYGEDDLLNQKTDILSLDEEESGKNTEEETEEPGKAIFTSGTGKYEGTINAKVNREQVRSKNKEELMKIVENDQISEEQKKQAIDAMVEITKFSEMENTIETILEAKGYSDIIVTVSENQADVILGQTMEDSDRAVIEDVITRKTGMSLESIVITPVN